MKKKLLILSFALGLFASSCEKMVEVEPKNQISDKAALSTIVGYESLLNSVYSRLIAFNYYGRDFILLGDVLSDNAYTELTYANGRYIGQNSNQVNSHYNIWTTAYAAINDANIIIETIDASADNTPAAVAKKPLIKAEALALRAMMYFDLARVYGYEPTNITSAGGGFALSVPLRLKATLGLPDAEQLPRATVAQVYASIESDLKAAISLLGPGATASTLRMNKGAAYALLGKVYLYSGRYPEAVTELDNAMNTANTAARLAGPGQYVTAFKAAPNPESFFELAINAATQMGGVTGSNESLYTYTHPNGYNGLSTFGGQTVSDELFALFTPGDDRLGAIFQFGGSSAAPTPVFNWSDKYSGARGAYTDNPKVIRFSDALLMKAEALAAQTQYGAAATVVTQLRTARNAAGAVPTDATVVNFIQQERRRELHFEGHRWFDLKRLANGITKPAKTGVGTIVATDFKLLAPIPNAEVILGITKNPLY